MAQGNLTVELKGRGLLVRVAGEPGTVEFEIRPEDARRLALNLLLHAEMAEDGRMVTLDRLLGG